jgi:hypothetical protein
MLAIRSPSASNSLLLLLAHPCFTKINLAKNTDDKYTDF